jgi:hypothetical protein
MSGYASETHILDRGLTIYLVAGSVHSALENRMTPEGLPRLVAGVSGVTNEEGRPRANG